MPTYTEQFFLMDPANPPPVGTLGSPSGLSASAPGKALAKRDPWQGVELDNGPSCPP